MAHYTVSTLVTQEQIHIFDEKKLKSSQYPVWMTQNPNKGDFGESKSKQFPGVHAPGHPTPLILGKFVISSCKTT